MDLIMPNNPSKCTWTPNASNSPHSVRDVFSDRKKVLPNILEAIGQTPMVELTKVPKEMGIKCRMFAKCEFFNPGGSVKDRIAYRMVQEAEQKGLLKPGYTVIEPTSGNTGIGLALACAVRGYRCVIVMPQKMSNEKVYALEALGAEIVRTPTEAAWDSPEGHIATSQKLQKEIPNSIILDQYTNPGNPLAHYDQTGTEIWEQSGGKVDYCVVGAGTGGSVTGIARKLKELGQTKIVGVDPIGSILAEPAELNGNGVNYYDVEGIGYDFIPTVLDRKVIDIWLKTNDKEALLAARKLIKEEGLLCGGSSGSAMAAALKIAKDLPEHNTVVVLLPDGIRNYLTKFVSDLWMESRDYKDPPKPIKINEWWWNLPVSNMTLKKPENTLSMKTLCSKVLSYMEESAFEQILLVNEENTIAGFIPRSKLLSALIAGEIDKSHSVDKIMIKQYKKVPSTTTLGRLSRILQIEPFVIVLNEQNVTSMATQTDLFKFICKD